MSSNRFIKNLTKNINIFFPSSVFRKNWLWFWWEFCDNMKNVLQKKKKGAKKSLLIERISSQRYDNVFKLQCVFFIPCLKNIYIMKRGRAGEVSIFWATKDGAPLQSVCISPPAGDAAESRRSVSADGRRRRRHLRPSGARPQAAVCLPGLRRRHPLHGHVTWPKVRKTAAASPKHPWSSWVSHRFYRLADDFIIYFFHTYDHIIIRWRIGKKNKNNRPIFATTKCCTAIKRPSWKKKKKLDRPSPRSHHLTSQTA